MACQAYATCGVLFGLCSLTNLTALSSVCCLKVCFPNHGEAWEPPPAGRGTDPEQLQEGQECDIPSPVSSGSKFSSSHACILVAGVWCYASVFAVGPLVRWGRYGPEPYGTACCIDWEAPNHELWSLSYIVCLFLFCYVLPCAIIILSYTCILMTVRGSRQAIQQHVSPQTKTANAHTLIVKVKPFIISCVFLMYVDKCSILMLSPAVRSCVHRLPRCLEPVRSGGDVGFFWGRHAGSSRCVRHRRHARQVLHHLQPRRLPAVQAQLPRMSLQRHIHAPPEDLRRESAVWPQGALRRGVAAPQGPEHFHTPVERTAGQLRHMPALR